MWERVCKSDEVTTDEPKAITVKGRRWKFSYRGSLYAIDNVCSHEHAYLTKGFIEVAVVDVRCTRLSSALRPDNAWRGRRSSR